VVPGNRNAAQNFAHLRFVVNELQQRLAPSALPADTKYVFCCRVQVNNEQMLVQQDDARAQAIENSS
jgi:hypothetical protein